MEYFFSPKSVAVIGASPNRAKGGNSILRNLITTFKGNIYPVNPKYDIMEGLPCYPSVKKIPGDVDTAIIFVPAREVPQAVSDCADKNIPGVIIESAGFSEIGEEGNELQMQLLKIRRETGIRLWGPNCMGLVDGVKGHVFSFMVPEAIKDGFIPGHLSLIVQSGMLSGGFLMDIVSNRITGINKVCSVGNKIDIEECDLLEYFQSDEQTKVIGLYLESIVNGRRFIELCSKSDKPIVVLKGGKSASGAEAAISHTASLAGNHKIIEGALSQAGVIEARDFKQMVDICRCLSVHPRRPAGLGRVAILTASGGAGIVATDFIEQYKLSLADFNAATKKSLEKLFPDWMPVNNPVDIWPAIEASMGKGLDVYQKSLDSLLADTGVDAILLCGFAGNSKIMLNMAEISDKSRKSGKPIFIWLFGLRDSSFEAQKQAQKNDVLIFQELERAVECLAAVMHQKDKGEVTPMIQKTPSRHVLSADLLAAIDTAHGPLDEHISKKILRAYGIPVVEEEKAKTIEECVQAAGKIGFPLVMKGIFPCAAHKTEMGLVRLNITDEAGAENSFTALMSSMNQKGYVLLQQQIEGKAEIILGMLKDRHFGPAVMMGIGGIMAEIFEQSVFAVAPLSKNDALGLIDRFPAKKILEGFRGGPAIDKNKFAEFLVALGEIGLLHPRIKEIDINPLIVSSAGIVAVDASIILE
ncbi:MAG: acetate--CoA ligase family protein [Syntrophaceae bacterium]|nr:acetate--CoA ligase family protein [Syntrophaceae bacterium]